MMWKALDYADIARFSNAHGAHATTIEACGVGLTLEPGNAMLYVYRAAAYDEFGRSAEAIADCERAIALAPGERAAVLAGITLALVYERAGDRAAALAAADAAIAIDPNEREAHAVRGTLLAWRGAYPAAWAELECHWLEERIACKRRFGGRTEWNGEDIGGRQLVLVHAQGLGDLVQMLRYLPRVRERCARITLEVPAPLLRLAATIGGADEIVLAGTTPPERVDAFARMMSLPRVLREDARAENACVPYIAAPATCSAHWTLRFDAAPAGARVGLAWAGNPAHENDRRRSIPFGALAPLATVPGIAWFSLQHGPRADDAAAEFPITRFGTAIADLADTSAIITQLDLVITPDTAVAHLAGALGKPVWLLLPWRPDWRWSPDAATTPWYPTMRLFHATAAGWPPLIGTVAAALERCPQLSSRARRGTATKLDDCGDGSAGSP